MNNDSNSKNYKIVYKKLINYDNDSSSTCSDLDTKINLDKIVDNTNNKLNKDTNLSDIKYQDNLINSNEYLRNNILKEINSNKLNNFEKNDINKNVSINIKKFVKYLKEKNIDLTKLNEHNILSNSINLFIMENKLNEQDVYVFLKELNQILDNNTNFEINDINKLDLNIENFQDINSEQQIKSKDIFELLKNNDINTWLFMGFILISFIIIIMIIIHNK